MSFSRNDLCDLHVWTRGFERYAGDLTEDDTVAMVGQIQRGLGILIGAAPGSRKLKIWMVWWPSAGRVVPVVYRGGKIRTILPPDVISKRWPDMVVAGKAVAA